ncbi:MAG: AraC family transcriptional regulator [Oceanococcus sp.]
MSTPLRQKVVPAAFTLLLFDHLESCGSDPEVVLGAARPSVDPEETNGIDVVQWEKMLDMAMHHLNDRYLGLKLGAAVRARHLGVVGHLLLASENFGAALTRLEQYQRLIFDAIPMTRRETDDAIEMVWDISEFRTGILVGETGFAVMVQFCRSLMQGDANPHSVDFAHPAPDDIRPYEEFFGCPVKFLCPAPILRVEHKLLERPLRKTDAALETLFEQHARQLLARLPQQEEIVMQVRELVAKYLRDGEPNIERVSTALCCSSRTLQRRLKELGTSFRSETNLVRNEMAKSYLRDPHLTLADIAQLLGYSEHSAFTRAFRQIHGYPPSAVA